MPLILLRPRNSCLLSIVKCLSLLIHLEDSVLLGDVQVWPSKLFTLTNAAQSVILHACPFFMAIRNAPLKQTNKFAKNYCQANNEMLLDLLWFLCGELPDDSVSVWKKFKACVHYCIHSYEPKSAFELTKAIRG